MFRHSAHNRDEFTELLRTVYEQFYRFARALTRTPQETDDLVSETILRAFENFSSIRDRQAFLAYLFTIASRIHKKKKKKFFSLLNFGEEEKISSAQSNEGSPEISADVQLMYDALDKLPAEMKEAVILFEISGMSLEEIRQIQGGSLSGVKSRVSRGRERLAKLLGVEIREKKFSPKKNSSGADDDEQNDLNLQRNILSIQP